VFIMAFAQWRARRIAVLWAAGLLLEALVVVGPTVLVVRTMRRNAPRILAEQAALNARWRAAELADAGWVAAQRAAGPVAVGADGTPRYAIVRMPSGRPDPAVVARFRARTERIARWIVAVQLGGVPALLALVTLVWIAARRRDRAPTLHERVA
jgi:hypothetical protein